MKRIVLKVFCAALCVSFAMLSLTGCVTVGFSGSGVDTVTGTGGLERIEYKVESSEITEIRIMMYCNIEYYSASSDTVTLDIQPNLMQYVTFEETAGGVLTLSSTRPINYGGSGTVPVLTVSSPALSTVAYAGAGTFTAHDVLTADTFIISISGAGECNAAVEVNHLSADISGAGSMNLSGTAGTAEFMMSGAGDINALALQTREADINMAGAGNVRISCSDVLIITASGAGSVEYSGSPSIDISRSGMVSIRNVD